MGDGNGATLRWTHNQTSTMATRLETAVGSKCVSLGIIGLSFMRA
jgi:hypothetical protein